jgi:putative ABC transport system ATP-binding protein
MIETTNIHKSFFKGALETKVLRGIDFKAADGEFVAIMGRSGAGKSTFMYQMSLLDRPTRGEIIIDGERAQTMSERKRVEFRLFYFGYVFQEYALLPELTALENVALPLLMQGKSKREAYRPPQDGL